MLNRRYLRFINSLEPIFYSLARSNLHTFSRVELKVTSVNFLRLGYLQSLLNLIEVLPEEKDITCL